MIKYLQAHNWRLIKKSLGKVGGGGDQLKILDIGCGNHSAQKAMLVFPGCQYSGIDREKNYNNNEADFSLMHEFYELDLTLLDFSKIPNNTFNIVRMSHVIEHLHNGDLVLIALLEKVKEGGLIYIEYPAPRSVRFPSMPGTLNFYDDSTHCRLYTEVELLNLIRMNGFRIVKVGTRRNFLRTLLLPVEVLYELFKYKSLRGGAFWGIYGFANYVIAKKSSIT